MAYHLYVLSGCEAHIREEKLDEVLYCDYQYLGEFAEKPDVDGKWYVDGKWVPAGEPQYSRSRQGAYPRMHEQLDALWHAMDEGLLPKVPGFYDKIKAVKDRFPKE